MQQKYKNNITFLRGQGGDVGSVNVIISMDKIIGRWLTNDNFVQMQLIVMYWSNLYHVQINQFFKLIGYAFL